MNPIKEWVEHHLPNKNDEDLWVYDQKLSDELIRPSKEEVKIARENINA